MLSFLLVLTLGATLQEPTTITSGESRAQEPQGQTLVFYDVRDLAASMPHDFSGPELGLSESPSSGQRSEPAVPAERLPAGYERVVAVEPTPEELEAGGRALERVIRTFLDPPLSGPLEQIRRTQEGTLVVSARPVQQAWIERFLNGLRGFDGLVALDAAIYTAPRGVLREWGIAPSATLASAADLQAFRERVDADGRFQIVNAPQLVQYPCQQANIAVVNQVAYVKSWQVQIVEPGRHEIADPEIAVICEGIVVDARTSPLPGERFGLHLELSSCELERPIPTRKVRISASTDQEVEVGEPEVKTARFAATVVLADGASAVLVTADTDPQQDLAVVVTVRRVAKFREEREK